MRGQARIAGLILLMVLAAGTVAVGQGSYPTKPITLVTHSSPGAGGDIFLRNLAKYLEGIVPVPIVVENRSGGSSARAVTYVATSPKDGYVLYGSTPTFLQTPILTKTPHTFLDLQPVANVFFDPMILYVKTDSPWKTLTDIVNAAKQRPGTVRFGAATPGSVEHMIAHQLQKVAKVQVQPVTFEGGGDLLLAVLGGHVDLGVGEYAEVASQVQAGQVRVVNSFTENRLPGTTIPTAKELGVNIVVTKFRGLLGPKGMDPAAIAFWEDAIKRVLARPAYRAYYTSVYLLPAYMDHVQYNLYLHRMNQELRRYMKEIGVIQ
ncbi:MAG: tripartite tricarboxylate transporter substrate binding protein [Armatimonadota bacterium]|nr:tripartite tricarboxylate transporter substrate binding protein [Armatimonadota bacterium]MDR7452143.1 tripartite tricarboxylate transporter substrate binding protein [Armatimonadota bacterium]MDR7467867.1 tripartite tricarboxylate transporter substrate binding protein [Armatimonadota bacterium]MDR7494755.1 tripartite tricarboxylate transporter substrate binding protein [Armatimonadota bacterium]MDR7499580.1 tripartite tricarboxylate transporter substrate binding protein [Armatimonadota bact